MDTAGNCRARTLYQAEGYAPAKRTESTLAKLSPKRYRPVKQQATKLHERARANTSPRNDPALRARFCRQIALQRKPRPGVLQAKLLHVSKNRTQKDKPALTEPIQLQSHAQNAEDGTKHTSQHRLRSTRAVIPRTKTQPTLLSRKRKRGQRSRHRAVRALSSRKRKRARRRCSANADAASVWRRARLTPQPQCAAAARRPSRQR